jgi:RNA polymerase-binding protein DksA
MDPQEAKRILLNLRSQVSAVDEDLTNSLAVSLEEEVDEESFDQHIGDVGAVTLERELDLSFQGNEERLLEQVDRALNKIDDGTYGRCDRCGRPIEEGRLRAVPYATLCLQHQRELERSQ